MKKYFAKYYKKYKVLIWSILLISLTIFFAVLGVSTKPSINIALTPLGNPYLKSLRLSNSSSSVATSVEIPVSPVQQLNIFWTIEGWFKYEGTSANLGRQYLVYIPTQIDTTFYSGIGLFVDNKRLYAEYQLPASSGTIGGATLNSDWHHVALVSDNKECTLYLDGTNIAQTTGSACKVGINQGSINVVSSIYIGSRLSKVLSGGVYIDRRTEGFPGQIDEIRISDFYNYTSNFTVPQEPFTHESGTWQYKFDSIGTDKSIIGFGSLTTTGYVKGNSYTLVDSSVPYTAPSPPPSINYCNVPDGQACSYQICDPNPCGTKKSCPTIISTCRTVTGVCQSNLCQEIKATGEQTVSGKKKVVPNTKNRLNRYFYRN